MSLSVLKPKPDPDTIAKAREILAEAEDGTLQGLVCLGECQIDGVRLMKYYESDNLAYPDVTWCFENWKYEKLIATKRTITEG